MIKIRDMMDIREVIVVVMRFFRKGLSLIFGIIRRECREKSGRENFE